ncbi:unnamed protein product [Ixodes pacificus]
MPNTINVIYSRRGGSWYVAGMLEAPGKKDKQCTVCLSSSPCSQELLVFLRNVCSTRLTFNSFRFMAKSVPQCMRHVGVICGEQVVRFLRRSCGDVRMTPSSDWL